VQKDVFIIDDPSQGAVLHRFQSKARVRTYNVKVAKTMRVRQVVFAEDCRCIVIGSDHGKVYVFDRRSGEIIDELEMSANSWVQTVTVRIYEISNEYLLKPSRQWTLREYQQLSQRILGKIWEIRKLLFGKRGKVSGRPGYAGCRACIVQNRLSNMECCSSCSSHLLHSFSKISW
jgi:hypothetical protein